MKGTNMNTKWYADESAKRFHQLLSEELRHIIANVCPGHELSHVGIFRDNCTEEVVLKLHLNPLGRITVVPNRDEITAEDLRLPRR
jgi:hypothetical protein